MTGRPLARGWLALPRLEPLAAGLAAIVAAALVFALFQGWAYDDPFITYRYADNLRQGLGFVYNPGQRVLSTTTPLFALLLAGLGWLWPDLPRLATLLGALSLAAGALCFWLLGRAWRTPLAGWLGLLLYPLFPALLTTLSSETPLYLALCLGAFAAYAWRRLGWAAALAALAALTRADGLLVAVVLALHYLWVERPSVRRLPWHALGIYVLVLLPWLLFALAYFGSPAPASLAAKQQQGGLDVSVRFLPGLLELLRDYARLWPYWLQVALAAAGLAGLAGRARPWALLLAWGALYLAGYTALGVSRYFWYYAPLVPAWLALAGAGAEWLAGALPWRRPAPDQAHPLGFVLVGLVAASHALVVVRAPWQVDHRMAIYRAAGEWLSQATPPGALVGSLEVGALGYYARRPMLDFAGLIQPAVAEQLGTAGSYEAAARWAINAYHPAYLVIDPAWFPGLLAGPQPPPCAPIQTFPGASYGYPSELIIYACAWR